MLFTVFLGAILALYSFYKLMEGLVNHSVSLFYLFVVIYIMATIDFVIK